MITAGEGVAPERCQQDGLAVLGWYANGKAAIGKLYVGLLGTRK